MLRGKPSTATREWAKFQKKGIKEAIVCKHVAGDLLKFYGVEGSGFFYFYYPTADGGFSKFGLERHNGKAHKYAFDTTRLTAEAEAGLPPASFARLWWRLHRRTGRLLLLY